jgi:hypothetical protein
MQESISKKAIRQKASSSVRSKNSGKNSDVIDPRCLKLNLTRKPRE